MQNRGAGRHKPAEGGGTFLILISMMMIMMVRVMYIELVRQYPSPNHPPRHSSVAIGSKNAELLLLPKCTLVKPGKLLTEPCEWDDPPGPNRRGDSQMVSW